MCPYCGSTTSFPSDMDSWWCPGCKSVYPTLAFKCGHPDCWEFASLGDYCEEHQPRAEKDKAE